jgi:hypothetical protein
MNFLNKYGFFLLIYTLCSSCNSNKVVFLSAWNNQQPLIDGEISEWSQPFEQPTSMLNISFKSCNDEKYLYLAVRVQDEYLKSLILNQGCLVWIDSSARKKEKFGFAYPLPVSDKDIESLAIESKGDESNFLRLYAAAMREFDIIGLAEEPLRASNLTSKDMKVAAAFDRFKGFNFEMRIPLKSIFKGDLQYNETFALGIQIKAAQKSQDDDNGDNNLFNDRNSNAITQSNPMMGPSPNQQQYAQPSNRQQSMPGIWALVKLSGKL